MQILKYVGWIIGLGIVLALSGISGCISPRTAEADSCCFVVKNSNGRARCVMDGSTHAQALKVGDKLHAGDLVQTAYESHSLVISMRKSVMVRYAPGSSARITQVLRGTYRMGDSAKFELILGQIFVQAKGSATCEIGFTNGTARICDGVMGVDDQGCVKVGRGSAYVTLAGESQPTVVPEGYIFSSRIGQMRRLTDFLGLAN